VVVDVGLTVRIAGLLVFVVMTPSDQVTIQLAVPVSTAWIVAEDPGQMLVVPLTEHPGASIVTISVVLFVHVALVTVSPREYEPLDPDAMDTV
jgi:hypothetical protein